MRKVFSVRVDGEVVPFQSIAINPDGTAVVEALAAQLYALSNFPKILDISHLTYTPERGARYNGETGELEGSTELPSVLGNVSRFALLVENTVQCVYSFRLDHPSGEMFTAIFRSNPEIFLERVEND